MTEIILTVVIFLLLLNTLTTQRQFLNHLKQLEDKLAKIDPEDKVASPNEIAENTYRDIDNVSLTEIKNK